MIMFIIVSYLLGWPHKKLTMSLIDLFPSANDVTTEPPSPVSSPLSLSAIICLWWSFWSFVVSKKNIIWKLCCKICDVVSPWVTHHPWSRTQCLWHRAGHQQWRDRKRDRGEKIVNRENKWISSLHISNYTSLIMGHKIFLPIIATGLFLSLSGHFIGLVIARVFSV